MIVMNKNEAMLAAAPGSSPLTASLRSSQTGLTNTVPMSPGCSDWKPQDTCVVV